MSMANFEMAVRVELARRKMTMAELGRQVRISADYTRKIINGKRKATAMRQEIKKFLNMEEYNEKSKEYQEACGCNDHKERDHQDMDRSQMARKAG